MEIFMYLYISSLETFYWSRVSNILVYFCLEISYLPGVVIYLYIFLFKCLIGLEFLMYLCIFLLRYLIYPEFLMYLYISSLEISCWPRVSYLFVYLFTDKCAYPARGLGFLLVSLSVTIFPCLSTVIIILRINSMVSWRLFYQIAL
jgi:hypothetical protein